MTSTRTVRRSLQALLVILCAFWSTTTTTSCSEDDEDAPTALVSAQRRTNAATVIALADNTFDTDNLTLLLNGDVVKTCDRVDEGVCISLVKRRQFALVSVAPGDLQLDIETPDSRGSVMLLDVRPQTTILVYLRKDGNVLRLSSHRRITAQDDGINGGGQWVADDLLNPNP